MCQFHQWLRRDGAREGAGVLDLDAVNLKVMTSDQAEPAVDRCDGVSCTDDAFAFFPYHWVRS